MSHVFISDLHLDPADPTRIEKFLDLLDHRLACANALYILGDLFEIWIGDDHIDTACEPVIGALRKTTRQGLPVFLMHGNRDFLIGDRFLSLTGCRLLDDPTLIEVYGQRTLLMHGDLLCTDDRDYQAFRRTVRNPEWQRQVLKKPVKERLAMARDARLLSNEMTQGKAGAIMDINPDTVLLIMQQYRSHLLIHGHTHRPGIHKLTLENETVTRAVLADWHTQGSLLRLTTDGLSLEYF